MSYGSYGVKIKYLIHIGNIIFRNADFEPNVDVHFWLNSLPSLLRTSIMDDPIAKLLTNHYISIWY